MKVKKAIDKISSIILFLILFLVLFGPPLFPVIYLWLLLSPTDFWQKLVLVLLGSIIYLFFLQIELMILK